MKSAIFDVTIRKSGHLFNSFLIEKSWDEVDAYEAELKAQYPSPNFSVEVFEEEEWTPDSWHFDPQY